MYIKSNVIDQNICRTLVPLNKSKNNGHEDAQAMIDYFTAPHRSLQLTRAMQVWLPKDEYEKLVEALEDAERAIVNDKQNGEKKKKKSLIKGRNSLIVIITY